LFGGWRGRWFAGFFLGVAGAFLGAFFGVSVVSKLTWWLRGRLFGFGFSFEFFEEGLFFVGEACCAQAAYAGGDLAVGLELGQEFFGLDGVGCQFFGIGEFGALALLDQLEAVGWVLTTLPAG